MPKKVLAVIEDLFFTVKINEAAKHAGLAAEFVKSEIDAIDRAKAGPAVIVIDLNCAAVDPLHLIAELKASPELKGISVVGFVSHVQGELKQKAQEAGCNMVLARSAFSQNMQQIFKRYAAGSSQ
ncbi:MAG: response regulator [Bryobacteraceae bacterium]